MKPQVAWHVTVGRGGCRFLQHGLISNIDVGTSDMLASLNKFS